MNSRHKSCGTPSFAAIGCVRKLWSLASRNYICRCAPLKSPRLSSFSNFERSIYRGRKCKFLLGEMHTHIRSQKSRPAPTFEFPTRKQFLRSPFLSRRADLFPLERRNTSHFTRPLKEKAAHSGKFICMPTHIQCEPEVQREKGKKRVEFPQHPTHTGHFWFAQLDNDEMRRAKITLLFFSHSVASLQFYIFTGCKHEVHFI